MCILQVASWAKGHGLTGRYMVGSAAGNPDARTPRESL